MPAQSRQPYKTPQHDGRLMFWHRGWVLYLLAGLLVLIGGYAVYAGFRSNQAVTKEARRLSRQQDDTTGSGGHPSTTKPSTSAIANYSVAPTLPRYIDIPKLGVHARVIGLSVTSQNQLQAPDNVYDAGWYTSSSQPGQAGAMLIDGHISSWKTHGVFYAINTLKSGDSVVITRGDGQRYTYQVVETEVVDAKRVDMSSLLVPKRAGKQGLNLISCGGEVIPGTNEFDKRVVVFTVLKN